jgi:hypothetical protein
MNHCDTMHQCSDGKQGECRQVQNHLGKHLCSRCLTFFGAPAADRPEALRSAPLSGPSPAPAAPVALPDVRRPAPIRAEPFQIFGIWKATVQSPYGAMAIELVLQPNKKFSQTAVLNNMMTYDTGTVELGEGYIHFVVQDHEPKVYNGVPMKWLQSWTYFYTVVDANTMTFEDRIANSRWNVYRG